MPRPSKLLALPPKVLQQLHERLRQSEFANFAAHARWLEDLGHEGSISAINVYAKRYRERIAGEVPAVAVADPARGDSASACVDRRIECLKVAGSLVPLERVKEVAADLLRWAEAGR